MTRQHPAAPLAQATRRRPLALAVLGLALLCPLAAAGRVSPPGYELPRRALLGASFAPASQGQGLPIAAVLPGTSFDAAGLRPGDLLVGLNGAPITAPGDLAVVMKGLAAGDDTVAEVVRGGTTLTLPMVLHPRPQEQAEDIVVEYGSVVAGDARLRTLVTRPRGEGPFPALMVLQGLGCFSVDAGGGRDLAFYQGITHELARRGILTLRVEKSGMGDSTGDPCSEIDFVTEGRGYLAALGDLVDRADVDREHVFLFGHSMGGVFAPWVANRIPVKGIAAFGTGVRDWSAYVVDNTRRQMLMAGSPPEEAEEACTELGKLMTALHDEGRPLPEVIEEHPEWAAFVDDPEHFGGGRHWRFFRQLGDVDKAALWAESGAHALAIYGSADFVSEAGDHAAIAEIANRVEPGRGRLVVLEGMDHFFRGADDFADSHRRMLEQDQLPFDERIIDTLADWVRSLSGLLAGA